MLIHPSHLSDLYPNVQVAFLLPPQLCNHPPKEWLLTLKHFIYNKHWCSYLEWWTRQIRHRSSEFWKSFNIWHVLENILAAWDSITSKTINVVCIAMQQGNTHSSRGSEEENDGVAWKAQKACIVRKAAFDEKDGYSRELPEVEPAAEEQRKRERWSKHGKTVNSLK